MREAHREIEAAQAGTLARQIDEIDARNERLSGITLLKGIEVDYSR